MMLIVGLQSSFACFLAQNASETNYYTFYNAYSLEIVYLLSTSLFKLSCLSILACVHPASYHVNSSIGIISALLQLGYIRKVRTFCQKLFSISIFLFCDP